LLRALYLLSLLFPDVLIPNFRVRRDVPFEQFPAFAAVEVDDFYAVGAQPVNSSGEGAALADDQSAKAKLPHKAAAIPARGERGDHDQVTIAALTACTAKGIGFSMDAGIALLHPSVVTSADKFAGARKDRRSDWNASLIEPQPRLFEGHCQHLFVQTWFRHKASLVPSIIVGWGG
jgi:hypothetical protein